MNEKLRRPRYSRGKDTHCRTVFVGARVGERTKHALEVLSLLHRESYSAVIERAIREISKDPVEFGGAKEPGGLDDFGAEESQNYVTDTWASEPWIRRLKIALADRRLLTPHEEAFWRGVRQDTARYFSAEDPGGIDDADIEWLRAHIKMSGYPDSQAISDAWAKSLNDGNDREAAGSRGKE
jgi:hypothetical protein